MRLLAWVFTLIVLFTGALIVVFASTYPEASYGLFGWGPYPLWAWFSLFFALGVVVVGLWLPALHLRAAAERKRLKRELEAAQRTLEEYERFHPEELPRIPDREPEGEIGT